MKWLLFLIPLLLYSFQSQAIARNNSTVTPAQCAARPVLYGVGMHNYWNDSDNSIHAYYEGCEYIAHGVCFDSPSTGYLCDWHPNGNVQPESDQGSASHPGNNSSDVDLSSMGSPVMGISNLKEYKKKGDSSGGKKSLLYNGVVYSVAYDVNKDVTTYTPVSSDPQQKQSFKSMLDDRYSNVSHLIESYNFHIKRLQDSSSAITAYLNSRPDDKVKYSNDYQSARNLLRVNAQLISAAQMDIERIKSLHASPFRVYFDSSRPKQYFVYDKPDYPAVNCGFDFSYCDLQGDYNQFKIVYHNKNILNDLKSKYYGLPDSSFIYSESDVYSPVETDFNVNSSVYFTSNAFFFKSSNTYLWSARNGYNPPTRLPFMDFSQSADDDSDNPDDSGTDNPDSGSGNPDTGTVTPPGGGGSGGGTVPPGGGGGGSGGGGDTGGTDNPGDTSQCAPGAPGWPDCDDQSGQPGGGDNPGDSGTGGDKPGGGGGGGTPGGGGGGHGSGGEGHGGGNTDGDGDALLDEVKRFHADVNAALNPDNVTVPEFDGRDVDLSGMQSDIDKLGDEQGAAWADASKQLESTLNGITGNLPSTKLDMSKVIPGGIPGVCRPWEFDIVIGLPDGKQLKQHVVMSDFCTWYDSYIRPFVTWVFNFLTAVAVFNILYKGLRTIN